MVESDLKNDKSKITLFWLCVRARMHLKLKSSISFLGAGDPIAGNDKGEGLEVSLGAHLSLVHSQRSLEIGPLSHVREAHEW